MTDTNVAVAEVVLSWLWLQSCAFCCDGALQPQPQRVVCLGAPNSLWMPEEVFLLLYDLLLLPTVTQLVKRT